MSWNYRVMAVQANPVKGWEEIYLTINDVYYDKEGRPNGYGELGEPPLYRHGETPGGDTLEELRGVLQNMTKALDKPILYGGDRWPQIYTPKI